MKNFNSLFLYPLFLTIILINSNASFGKLTQEEMMKNAKVFMNDCASDVTKFCSTYDRSKPAWKRNCIEAQDPSKLSKACLVALNTIKESISPGSSVPKSPEVSTANVSSTEELFNEFINLMNEYKKTHGSYSYDFNNFQTRAYTIPITVTIYSPMECLKKFNPKAKKFSFSTFPNLKIEKLNKKEATDALMFYEVTNKMQAGNYEGKLCPNNTDNFWLGASVLKADGKIDSYTLRKTGAIFLKDKAADLGPSIKTVATDSDLKKACEKGDVKACGILGVHKDKEGKAAEAKELFVKACSGGSFAGCVELGTLNEKAGDYSNAKRLFSKACTGGELFGCNKLGRLEEKNGSKSEAKKIFAKACDAGDMHGCSNLGNLEEKLGNHSEAKKLLTKTCDHGDLYSCNNLGRLEEKLGNNSEAKKIFAKACDAGDMHGCSNLGNLEEKLGNHSEAKKLLTKTCDHGDLYSCNGLGKLEEKLGNKVEAKKLYQSACDAADLDSCIDLGILTEKQGNSDEAKKLYARACDGGVLFGCSRLGTLEEELGHKKEAKILYTKACNGGYLSGCNRLGIMEFGYGDKSIAKKLFIKACDGGVMSGCSDLGLLLIDEGNKTEAKKFLKMGCDAGFNASCKNLNEMSSESQEFFQKIIEQMNEYKKAHQVYSYDFNDFLKRSYTATKIISVYSPDVCAKKYNPTAKKTETTTMANDVAEKMDSKEEAKTLKFFLATAIKMKANKKFPCPNNSDNFALLAFVLNSDTIETFLLSKEGGNLLGKTSLLDLNKK